VLVCSCGTEVELGESARVLVMVFLLGFHRECILPGSSYM